MKENMEILVGINGVEVRKRPSRSRWWDGLFWFNRKGIGFNEGGFPIVFCWLRPYWFYFGCAFPLLRKTFVVYGGKNIWNSHGDGVSMPIKIKIGSY